MAYLTNIKFKNENGIVVTHKLGASMYGTCSTAAATAAKVVVCADFAKLEAGVTIHVVFTATNSVANPTLNVNSTGAKPIYLYGTTRPVAADTPWGAGDIVAFTYNGTGWVMDRVVPAPAESDIVALFD